MPCARPICRRLSLRSSLASSARVCSVLPSLLACARASAAACEYQKTSWSAKVSSAPPSPQRPYHGSGNAPSISACPNDEAVTRLAGLCLTAPALYRLDRLSQPPNLANTGWTLFQQYITTPNIYSLSESKHSELALHSQMA
ncbi:hypothetical protein KC347_g116 [Hortaea werneckii]|nr:hypothetical protein KC347_g116 [Hortaea werneckii]